MSSDRGLRRCRESEEKLKNKGEEKADEAVEASQEDVEKFLDEQLVDQQLETVSAEPLDMEEDTAENVGIMLAKVVVVSGSCAREINPSVHNVCPNPSLASLPRACCWGLLLHMCLYL